MQERTFSVAARPPFRLDLTVWALRRWDGRTYRHSLTGERGTFEPAAIPEGSSTAPRRTVTLSARRLTDGR